MGVAAFGAATASTRTPASWWLVNLAAAGAWSGGGKAFSFFPPSPQSRRNCLAGLTRAPLKGGAGMRDEW